MSWFYSVIGESGPDDVSYSTKRTMENRERLVNRITISFISKF